MTTNLDYTKPCPGCQKPIAGFGDCLANAGFDYTLPYENVPGAPITFPGVEGDLVGEVTVMAATVTTPIGVMPVVRFIFTGPGADPMSRRSLRPINLLMDGNGLRSFRTLVSQCVDQAILAARRQKR